MSKKMKPTHRRSAMQRGISLCASLLLVFLNVLPTPVSYGLNDPSTYDTTTTATQPTTTATPDETTTYAYPAQLPSDAPTDDWAKLMEQYYSQNYSTSTSPDPDTALACMLDPESCMPSSSSNSPSLISAPLVANPGSVTPPSYISGDYYNLGDGDMAPCFMNPAACPGWIPTGQVTDTATSTMPTTETSTTAEEPQVTGTPAT